MFAPAYGVLCAERRLVEVFVLGGAGKPREMHVFDSRGIRGSKNRAHIMNGPNIVNHEANGVFGEGRNLVGAGALDFIPTKLTHLQADRDVGN